MRTIGNEKKQIGGGDAGQHTQNTTSSSSKGWNIPWWIFNFIKFMTTLSPTLGKVLGFLITITAWLINSIITTLKTFSAGVLKGILRMFWVMLILGLALVVGVKAISYSFNFSGTEITWYSIVVPLIFIAAAGYVVRRVIKAREKAAQSEVVEDTTSTPNTKTPIENNLEVTTTFFEVWWVKGKILPMLACFILIHYAIYQLFPGFWWNNIFTLKSFGLQLALLLVMSIKPENPKKPTKHKLSTVAAVLLGITLLLHIGQVSVEGSITKTTNWWETNRTKSTLRTTPVTSRGEVKYPRNEHWSDKDTAEQILEGQWDLLAACYRESGLKQFNADGKPLINENKNGLGAVISTDTGICQINSIHDPELATLGLDKNKLEDNLKYAKILYEREGLKPWNIQPGQKLTFQVPISDKGSNTFKKPENVYALFNNKEAVHVALNNERWITVLEADPGFTDFTPAGKILDYKFRLLPGKTENAWVTVTYTYQ